MATNVVVAGLAMAAIGFSGKHLADFFSLSDSEENRRKYRHKCIIFTFSGRALARYGNPLLQKLRLTLPSVSAVSNSRYYKGGFEVKMDKREASMILGVRWAIFC
jgi:hypothetical protein